jgi:2,3-bisphosphoglycerate-independent phosphoglycerate mutase
MPDKPKIPKPVVLIILDGWGVAPPSKGNAITLAKTPFFDYLVNQYPTMTLQASGEAVGLPWGKMGNSEVGHLNLGAGRIVYQSLPRIDKSIKDGSFYSRPAFLKVIKHVKKNKSGLHLLGLTSSGCVHSDISHLFALLELAKKKGLRKVYVHAILDGRDMPRDSGIDFIKKLVEQMKKLRIGKLATISGRFYTMDRDNHWERVIKAYQAMVEGRADKTFKDPIRAVNTSYKEKIYDEEFVPVVITHRDKPVGKVTDGDGIIFYNFRPDRAREMTSAFVLPEFDKFSRTKISKLLFVTMTEYREGLPVEVVFPPEKIEYPLARIISDGGLKQFHIAETQKYAHVTYFFNGGQEELFKGQNNFLVPSPRVASYAKKPEMSASQISKELCKEVNSNKYDFVVVNFANLDMVGHTGDLAAVIQAAEVVDKLLENVVETILARGGLALVIADHGNAEQMINLRTGEIDKEHTTNPVPFIIVGTSFAKASEDKEEISDLSLIAPVGVLADVAPTILKIMGLKQPEEMNGRALI